MTESERELHRKDIADLYVQTFRRFDLSGTLFTPPAEWRDEDLRRSFEHLREISGWDYFVPIHGDATYAIPDGTKMMDFVSQLADEPQAMKDKADWRVDGALQRASAIKEWGVVDGFCLCADYCFNDSPFLSPAMFDEFVTPYLKRLIEGYRELGFYVIKHTDGNIMPILDSLVAGKPHALHSLDPQGNVNLAEVKDRIGDRFCLIGNVNCALLQTGTDQEAVEDIRRALREGMPGGRYVFGSSNCIYTGMSLNRYQLMIDTWRKEGNYS
jgi:uroporphyrinogen decarboxylase